jgi:hypothetical protein
MCRSRMDLHRQGSSSASAASTEPSGAFGVRWMRTRMPRRLRALALVWSAGFFCAPAPADCRFSVRAGGAGLVGFSGSPWADAQVPDLSPSSTVELDATANTSGPNASGHPSRRGAGALASRMEWLRGRAPYSLVPAASSGLLRVRA